jgi:hypothetical protein
MVLMVPVIVLKPVLARRVANDLSLKQSQSPIPNAQAPWGQLEYRHFALGQPNQYLPDSTNALPLPEWHFEKTTPGQVTALFHAVDASQSVKQRLLDTNSWEVSGDTVVVRPTLETVLQLGRPARKAIYAVLAVSPVNMPQYYPFRFRGQGFDEWLGRSQLASNALALVHTLIYTNRSGTICLADLDVLQAKLERDEFRRLLKNLYSQQSLFLSLRVAPGSDLDRLASYWGSGGREQDVLALLNSVAQSGGGSIDVAHLLPSFARLRLYRFALESNSVAGQDCFWTALNFFRNEVEAQNSPPNRSLETLMTTHAETLEPPRFGDVIVFLENRQPAHACVYIADDVVFTKNGVNQSQPWILMKLQDVLPRYATDRPMSLVVLRQKTT